MGVLHLVAGEPRRPGVEPGGPLRPRGGLCGRDRLWVDSTQPVPLPGGFLMRVTLNQDGVRELLSSSQGPVAREMASLTRQVQNRAKQKVGVGTGRLRGSVTGVVNATGDRGGGTVGAAGTEA